MVAKKTSAKKNVGATSKAKKEETEEVVVDQAYFDSHPELADAGVSIGDTIEVSKTPKSTAKGLDMDGDVAILKGDVFIRIYPAGSEENVKSFLSKDGKYVAVEAESIIELRVPHSVTEKKTGVVSKVTEIFNDEKSGKDWIQQAINFRNEKNSVCIAILG